MANWLKLKLGFRSQLERKNKKMRQGGLQPSSKRLRMFDGNIFTKFSPTPLGDKRLIISIMSNDTESNNEMFNASIHTLVTLMIKIDQSLNPKQPDEVVNKLKSQLGFCIRRDYLDGWAMIRISKMRRKPRNMKRAA